MKMHFIYFHFMLATTFGAGVFKGIRSRWRSSHWLLVLLKNPFLLSQIKAYKKKKKGKLFSCGRLKASLSLMSLGRRSVIVPSMNSLLFPAPPAISKLKAIHYSKPRCGLLHSTSCRCVLLMEPLPTAMRVQSPEWLQKAQESGSVHKQSTMQIEKSCFTYAGKN